MRHYFGPSWLRIFATKSNPQLTRVDVHMKNGMEKPMTQIARRTKAMPNLVARAVRATLCAGALALVGANALAANPSADQATRIYNRIAGIPPTAAQLAQMTATDPVSAALIATNDPAFYNNTIRNLAAPWTNRDQSVFVPLNDYTATVIGMVRDNVPFNTLLSADLVYTGDGKSGEPAYSASNNAMYDALDSNNVDLSVHLVSSTQSALEGIPATATAGVLTTRGAASAFFINGTNRAMFRFTMLNHLCNDMQLVMDITRPPDRIRQDVTRSPGGVSTLVPDQLRRLSQRHGSDGAGLRLLQFQRHRSDHDGHDRARSSTPPVKCSRSTPSTTPISRRASSPWTTRWNNRWRTGPNYILGWSATLPGSGNGAKSLGLELESSAAFANCQVTRVFKDVCLRAPNSQNGLHPDQLDDLFVPIAQLFVAAGLR